MFKIHLVADAGTRGNCLEIVEALRSPFQKVITLAIAIIFDFDILLERLGVAEFVNHHRMVDNQVDGNKRVDLAGIAAQLCNRIAHRGQIDHARHAGEILQQYARRAILDFILAFAGVLLPIDQCLCIGGRNGEAAIFKAQQIFEQHLHAERQARNIAQLCRRFFQGIIGIAFAAHIQCGTGA